MTEPGNHSSPDRDGVVILSAARTPIGAFQGALSSFNAPQLGAAAVAQALAAAGPVASRVDQAFIGCVLTAGLGQAPARQAVLGAGLPDSVGCITINKMCGSGMQAIICAHDALLAGSADFVIAAGMESMTRAPYLLLKARAGQRLGHGELKDHMFLDGLEDAYESGRLMGSFADETARELGISRQQQDDFALASLARAKKACENGSFDSEIAALSGSGGNAGARIDRDETPFMVNAGRIPTLKPAFSPNGTVTAANASSISDGAAALVLTRRSCAKELGLKPLAQIKAHAVYAGPPSRFATAPVGAIDLVYRKTGWNSQTTDLFEINEAFAMVTLAAISKLKLDPEKVNPHGGACALGHPIGASGARIVVTLLAALRTRGLRRGVASLCIGGGEATALAVDTQVDL